MAPEDPKARSAPFAGEVADAAAHWLTELMPGELSAEDRERWRQWRAADPEHERAWQHIEAMSGRLVELDAEAAIASLSPRRRSRRVALKSLAVLGMSSGAGYMALRSPLGRQLRADVRTAKGEQREVAVGPTASVRLNTDTAINMAIRAGQAMLELVEGEIIVDARAGAMSPFLLIRTAFAELQVQAGKIQLRQFPTHTAISVLQGQVRLQGTSQFNSQMLTAGLSQRVGVSGLSAVTPLQADATAWVDGQLIADDMPLGIFLAELARYRPGIIRCDPDIAQRRVSGVFPLANTDAVLAAVARATGSTLRQRTRYWIVLEAA